MRILIVGAGIGGLTLASALGRNGWCIDIAERSHSFNPAGVGIVLHPNGIRILSHLGLGERISQIGTVVRYMELVRGAGVVKIDLAEVWEGKPTYAALRTELHELLLGRATSDTRLNLRMGCRITGVEFVNSHPVVRFDTGDTEAYDLVVGADGVHSALRHSLFPDAQAICTNLLYFRFPARNVVALPPDAWRTFELGCASYGFIPIARDRVHCFVQLQTAENPCPEGQEEDYFRTNFGGWDRALVDAIDSRCGPMHVGFAYMVRPVRWGRNRCVLLGDAAHAVSPTLSEGGSLAMEDALVLALALRRSASLDAAIRSYGETRAQRIIWAQRMALSQVNASRRQRTHIQVSSAVATSHMWKMYEPLRGSPVPEAWTDMPLQGTRDPTVQERSN
jgi:2-polyprenyl-6-methoxyphenol hydroxylase-like FAD-dependent oxidoreductase